MSKKYGIILTGEANIENQKNKSNSGKPVDNSKVKKEFKLQPKKKGRGGARAGAGRPKGGMNAETIEKMKVKKEFEDRVARYAGRLFNAQVSMAMGAQSVFKRCKVKTKKGPRWSRFEIVSDPEEVRQFLDGDFKEAESEYYMITMDKPDLHAIDSLLDRAFGKAPQNLNIKDDRPDPIGLILSKFGLLPEGEENKDAAETKDAESLSS